MRIVRTPVDAGYPTLRIQAAEFLALPEYSATLPTGAYPGKRWRRLDGCYDRQFLMAGGKPRWVIGEYHEIPDKTKVGLRWWKPIIVVRSAAGTAAA
jgi:hypothetical protein